jgi:pyruvate/2-oxoglutarate dehydrogenase complex dihydrolipoamide dehydrogenase (E3) component
MALAAQIDMSERIEADLCVIGAGSGGLALAAGAAQLGARTVLIERGKMGGDCLNVGCVPSKALLAAAKRAEAAREGAAFGLSIAAPIVDFPAVMRHVRGVIAAIAPHDSQERFEGLGVRVIRAGARFASPDEVEAGDVTIRARRIAIATGSSPALPAIPGLAEVPHFTNETIFDNDVLPTHLLVIGGGPVGLELAQAFRLLGSDVSVLEAAQALAKDDPEMSAQLLQRLRECGIKLREGASILSVARGGEEIVLTLADGTKISGSHLLVAAGRRANLDLALDRAGIIAKDGRLLLDRRLRTTNKKVFALGDAAGGPQFTHVALYHAGIVIRNALFRLPSKVDYRALPWVTYTEPELAHVGLTEAEARQRYGKVTVLRWPLIDNDRAQAEHVAHGLVKVVAWHTGRILGASILGAQAGELIQPWGLAISGGLRLGALAQMMAPYPTLGEASKRAAGAFYTPRLFGKTSRRLVRFLARFG